jgi:hypothetical protein
MNSRELRRALRLDVSGEVTTRIVDLDQAMELRDAGPGGFLLWSPVAIAPDIVHRVQFTAADGWTTTLPARSVHVRRLGDRGGTPIYAVGFAFVYDPAEATEQAVSDLIDKLTVTLSFD